MRWHCDVDEWDAIGRQQLSGKPSYPEFSFHDRPIPNEQPPPMDIHGPKYDVSDACKAWVHETKAALQPYALGAYGQLAGNASVYDEQTAHDYHTPGEGAYGWASNLARLRAAKAKFDPNDLFVNTDHIKKA